MVRSVPAHPWTREDESSPSSGTALAASLVVARRSLSNPSRNQRPGLIALIAAWVVVLAVASEARGDVSKATRTAKDPLPYDAGKLDFTVSLGGVESSYRVFAFYVVAGDTFTVVTRAAKPAATFLLASKLETTALGGGRWRLEAPPLPGLYPIQVIREQDQEAMTLNVFVQVPFSAVKEGKLGDYRIGEYPAVPLRGDPVYLPPRGLVEVTAANANTPVSPHFTLAQFLCKQEGSFPKYVVLREHLLLKLELLLELFNQAGYRADTFGFISGYRTPYYNARIDNVPYSRHTWGDAADIYLDGDGDGRMDDLDGDGHSGAGDARFFRDFVESLSSKTWYRPFEGGLGDYPPNAAHGPFVHVDCRGFRARWSG